MSDNTKDIQEKLEYINLDLNNVPRIFYENANVDFRPARSYEEKKYKVYKYVPISQIKILLTMTNRLNTLQEKSKAASPLYTYLFPEGEEGILKHTIFLKMIQDMKIKEIMEIDEEQKRLNKQIPFKVKYKENYLWQIYYSEYSKTYFMLAPIEDLDCSCLFYLIKEQIKYERTGKDKMIFVPISYLDYSRRYFTKSQVEDIEKYLWQFTKDWPLVYEVYDKDDNMSFQIVGNTEVYEKMASSYKIVINNDEDANRFYKLIKALFILETEFPNRYNFEARISENGGLEFVFNLNTLSKVIDYESLKKFIKEEYLKSKVECDAYNEEVIGLYEKLEKLKEIESEKEEEYRIRQKQVTTYLECRKSFFGKIRYFFKGKSKIKDKEKSSNILSNVQRVKISRDEPVYDDNKEYYTIEDLIDITKVLERTQNQIRNTNKDIKALELSIERLDKRIKNAKNYIEEINEHKKSIFDFWRFVDKDNLPGLNEPEQIVQAPKPIEKSFDYSEDMEDLGKKFDKQNRSKFSKEEFNSLFLASTDIIEDINAVKNGTKEDFTDKIEYTKKEALEEEILFSSEEFDIFGGMTEDKTKINTLGNIKHREIKKSKFRILQINKNTEGEQYVNRLKEAIKELESAISKSKLGTNLSTFYASSETLNNQGYCILNINPKNAMEVKKNEDKVNLYNIKLKENTKAIALTNIVYYDNANLTLPIGMDISDKIFVDMSMLKLEPKKQKLFRVNQEIDELNVKTKIVCVYEYEVVEE